MSENIAREAADMPLKDALAHLDRVEAALHTADDTERSALLMAWAALLERCRSLSAQDKVYLARHPRRPKIDETVQALFTDFFEQRGDRQCREDASILGGIARFHGRPVTVVGHRKGRTLEENMACNFGMPGPEGYRKALRIMRQAEKFGRPIFTFIDTPGAYPGIEAEERGQSEAIARNLAEMSRLRVPVIAVITGEGNSGGALALGLADRMLMLENAYFAVLSPEGFSSILWKDAARRDEACGVMKLTAQDLLQFGIIDDVVPEPPGGAQRDRAALFASLDAALMRALDALDAQNGDLLPLRYKKYREIGASFLCSPDKRP